MQVMKDRRFKEADTIKVPAFPTPESYRNWRIKTREAVVAASTKPDEAFRWVNEAWKEGQSLEALRKVEPFNTLDAKLMSALTNVITGHFARIVDTFKENEASADRIVRGRQILFMLHALSLQHTLIKQCYLISNKYALKLPFN